MNFLMAEEWKAIYEFIKRHNLSYEDGLSTLQIELLKSVSNRPEHKFLSGKGVSDKEAKVLSPVFTVLAQFNFPFEKYGIGDSLR